MSIKHKDFKFVYYPSILNRCAISFGTNEKKIKKILQMIKSTILSQKKLYLLLKKLCPSLLKNQRSSLPFVPSNSVGIVSRNLCFLTLLCTVTCITAQTPFTVLIDPTGDAQHTGREIKDTFERGITLQCAQEIKTQLANINPDIRVILTRVPGETIQPLHNAIFANRLQAQLYLRIGFYHEPEMPCHVAIFYYLQHQTDFWHRFNALQFYTVQQAYLANLNVSKQLGTLCLQKFANKDINCAFIPYGLFGIPLKPLIGIQAPALYIEAGLHNTNDWKYLIKPVIQTIQAIHS